MVSLSTEPIVLVVLMICSCEFGINPSTGSKDLPFYESSMEFKIASWSPEPNPRKFAARRGIWGQDVPCTGKRCF